jgi:hypothetical protein
MSTPEEKVMSQDLQDPIDPNTKAHDDGGDGSIGDVANGLPCSPRIAQRAVKL